MSITSDTINLDVTLTWRPMEKQPGADCFSKHIKMMPSGLHSEAEDFTLTMLLPVRDLWSWWLAVRTLRDSSSLSITSWKGVDTWKFVYVLF